jgi:hypothetical protein
MHIFMSALLSTANIEDAASMAGISATTAYRWHSQPDFQAEFRKMQQEVVGHALIELKMSMSEALNVLRNVMSDSENPPSSRVAAARTVLDNAFKSLETADILERLEQLESRMEGESEWARLQAD